jgi:preprotein translocase subunit SecF
MDIEQRIETIEARNRTVESNKAWENSLIRRVSIAMMTYIVVVIYHLIIGAKNVYIISAVPVIGFILSTLSLQYIRSIFNRKQK